MTLDLRFRAYAPNGAALGYIPAPISSELSAPWDDVGALKLAYPVDGPRSSLMGGPVELAAELSGDGGNTWVEPPGCRYLYLRDGRDPLKPGDTWDVEAPSWAWRLKKSRVAFSGINEQGQRPFPDDNPGGIMDTLFTEAKARGGLVGVGQTWTRTHDSAGQPWPETFTRDLTPGADMLTVLLDLVAAGYCHWDTAGRDLRLFVPTAGVDRTTGANQVTLAATQSGGAPFRRTWEGVAGAIILKGEGSLLYEHVDGATSQPWGRWEEFVTHSGVTDQGTLVAIGEHEATLTNGPRLEVTRDITPDAGPRPFLDYFPGDHIWTRDLSGAPTKYRVRQVTLSRSASGFSGNVVLNDRFVESDIRTQRRLQALSGGASVSGSSGTSPVGADILPPAAPAQPSALTEFYVDSAGGAHATVTLDWLDVTTNMDGTPITDLAAYEVWSKLTVGGVWALAGETAASVAYLSGFDPGAQWDFRVRARDSAGNLSDYSPVRSVLTAQDDDPPAEPSVPIVDSVPGGIVTVVWDGDNAAGNPMDEPDLFRVEVHASSAAGFVPTPGSSATMVGSMSGPTSVAIPGFVAGDTYYIRLVAVDTSLNASPPSDAVSVVAAIATDGQAPVLPGGWAPTLEPLGLMALAVSWEHISNADAVEYDVYAGATSPVPLTADHFVGSTASTGLSFSSINGSQLLAGNGYYVRVVPRDGDGPAATSGSAGPVEVRQAGEGTVSLDWAYLGPVEADQIRTGSLTASLAIIGELATSGSGRKVSMSSANGFQATDPTGAIVASIPTDLNQDISLRADVIAESVTALGSVAMRAADNELAQGAALILRSATAAPVSPPTVAITWEQFTGTGTDLWNGGGGAWDAATSRYYAAGGGFGYGWVDEYNASGSWLGRTHITNPEAGWQEAGNATGCYRDGSFLYALVYRSGSYDANVPGYWQVQKWDWTTKTKVAQFTLATDPNTLTSAYPNGHPAIFRTSAGNVGILYVEVPTGRVGRASYQPATATFGAFIDSDTTATVTLSSDIRWAWEGSADLGVTRTFFGTDALPGQVICLKDPLVNFTRDTTREFQVAYGHRAYFVTWNATSSRFVTHSKDDRRFYGHEGGGNTWTTESSVWHVTNTWRDTDTSSGSSAHETSQGPSVQVSMAKRARLVVTTPPIPTDSNNANLDDANAVSIYVGRGDGSRTTQWRQAQPANGVRVATLTNVVFSNADTLHPNPPLTGNFPNATPALIKSDAADGNGPRVSVSGDGAVRLGNLQVSAAGVVSMIGDVAAGAPSYGSGWSGSATAPPFVVKTMGVVYVSGIFNKSTWTPGETVMTLPVGMRPARTCVWTAFSGHAGRFTTGGAMIVDSAPSGGGFWLNVTPIPLL